MCDLLADDEVDEALTALEASSEPLPPEKSFVLLEALARGDERPLAR